MSKVICAREDCKWNGDKHKCTCKELNFSCSYVATVNDGRQDFWVCRMFEQTEWSKQLEESFNEILRNKGEQV